MVEKLVSWILKMFHQLISDSDEIRKTKAFCV